MNPGQLHVQSLCGTHIKPNKHREVQETWQAPDLQESLMQILALPNLYHIPRPIFFTYSPLTLHDPASSSASELLILMLPLLFAVFTLVPSVPSAGPNPDHRTCPLSLPSSSPALASPLFLHPYSFPASLAACLAPLLFLPPAHSLGFLV